MKISLLEDYVVVFLVVITHLMCFALSKQGLSAFVQKWLPVVLISERIL